MEWLNFRHLYAFWMVARTGSFTGAARQMHVVQSSVSAQVASLEEHMGVLLIERRHRTVELTPAGREVLRRADAIFQQSRAINAWTLDSSDPRARRSMRLGIVGGASRNFVSRLLERYQQRVPDATIAVSTGSYVELYGMLRNFELDAVVTLDLPRKQDMNEVTYRKLDESLMCIAGTPTLLDAVRSGAVDELDVYVFRHPFEVEVIERFVSPELPCRLVSRVNTDDVPLLRFLANSGRGVAVVPSVGVLDDVEAGKVEIIELRRCPEIQVYGITMAQSSAGEGDAFDGIWD